MPTTRSQDYPPKKQTNPAPWFQAQRNSRHTDQSNKRVKAAKTEKEPVDDTWSDEFYIDSDGVLHDIDEMNELRG